MLYSDAFNDNEIEVKRYELEVSGASSIHFTLLQGEFEHFFVIVKDTEGIVRALLSYKTRIKTYCLSTSILNSDNNTVPGDLQDGTWTIQIIRTYPIKGGFQLEVNFNLNNSSKDGRNPMVQPFNEVLDIRNGWYKGDFHLHSAYTDGRVTHEEIMQAAIEKKLDYIAMSDHSSATTKFPKGNMLVIPSTEITWDDNGHYNIHGLTTIPDYTLYLDKNKTKSEALNSLLSYYHNQNCVVSINHPFPYGWELLHDYDIQNIDLIEVINAPHLLYKEVDNERAVCFFDYLWQNGYLLKAIGGSDAHKKNYYDTYPIGIPTTKVYCEGLSLQNILQAIRKGNSFLQVEEEFEISYHRPQKSNDLILPGDCVEGDVEIQARCQNTVIWQIIKNGKVLLEKESKFFCHCINVKKDEYYRLQARRKDRELILFVNPIHNIINIGVEHSFQTILHQFYESEK